MIGPGCVLHIPSFEAELDYLIKNGFDASLVKVSPRCHIVQEEHIKSDKKHLAKSLGTTSKGIAPVYAAKAARMGVLAKEVLDNQYIWDEKLPNGGKILCEGAQGVWLDMDYGDYPYVTSSTTLPHAACSLGFPVQKIKEIWGAAKIYDTRSGEDPRFPDSLFDDPELAKLCELGQEVGVTTGRRRKVDWLDTHKLTKAINFSGATHIVISKCDIIELLGIFKIKEFNEQSGQYFITEYNSFEEMFKDLQEIIKINCPLVERIFFSSTPMGI